MIIPPSIETLQYWVEVSARQGMSYVDMAHELRRHLDETWVAVPEMAGHWSELLIENRRRNIVWLIRQLERQSVSQACELPPQEQYAVAEPVAVAA
jgi:hypothetical protein